MTAGAWRDPQKSRAVMDYFECHNLAAVEMLDHYCRIVKEESKGTLPTMAFFGYTMDENWSIENDHRAISKLLNRRPAATAQPITRRFLCTRFTVTLL